MFKPFGALYLILGTCIAAGMLGLPIVTATYHFSLTVVMLLIAWGVMTTGAWCLLQVNMQMPRGANFVSMSQKTFGNIGKIITWCVYLMLLIALVCAYLGASTDLLYALLNKMHLMVPRSVATLLASIVLGSIVYQGIHAVDYTNRVLMSIKFVICFILIGSVIPFSHTSALALGNANWHGATWLVMITAFGYGSILPSIRDYLGNNKKQLTRIFWIGSFIPIILYLLWIAVIQGALPRAVLAAMNNSANTNSLLMGALVNLTHKTLLQSISVVFISICSVTGFLSVTTSLFDTLTDGFKHKVNRLWIAVIALLPPLLIVVFDPSIFIRALAYAGVCCLYMLVILPIAMFIILRKRMR
ncbi:MAG: aromatic amino acid transport family protein [Coxiellaceae bacterium]|nr:aromatic amino acid transport family protein [Coxiellaceae bacterium]